MAVTSQWFLDNLANQRITHTPQDDIDIVDSWKLVEIARSLDLLIRRLDG